MLITKIEVQKKNTKRYSLFSEQGFQFGISEDTLIYFNIGKGKEYSDQQVQDIQHYEDKIQCLNQAYRFLSRRPHLINELKRKLKQKNYESELIEQVLDILAKKKYMDDRTFIQLFVSEQIRLKQNGPLLIKKKLLEKGAVSAQIDVELSTSYPENKQILNAQILVDKKTRNKSQIDAQKLYRFLQQKGFSWDIIRKIEIKEDLNQESSSRASRKR